jgi:acyl carrier protein
MKKFESESFLVGMRTAFEKPPQGLSMVSKFRELQGWDSLAAVMLVAEIYADYRVQISAEELRGCEAVEDLFSLVQTKHPPIR